MVCGGSIFVEVGSAEGYFLGMGVTESIDREATYKIDFFGSKYILMLASCTPFEK